MVSALRRPARLSLLVGILFLGSTSAHAQDGVVLINQTAAEAGNVTPGDAAGFPVSITQPGSYKLSSNLTVPANQNGIDIASSNVTLDLNGFTVFGGGGTSLRDGIDIGGVENVVVRDGAVRGFGRYGIFGVNQYPLASNDAEGVRIIAVQVFANTYDGIRIESQGALVERCTVHKNGRYGIAVSGAGTLVLNNVVRANAQVGISAFSSTSLVGLRSNVLSNNNGGDANAQISGGVSLGDNLCGTAICQ